MTEGAIRELPEQARACLDCACENPENLAGQELLRRTGSTSPVGVLAAVFVAVADERDGILALVRDAILEQRALCVNNGRFKEKEGCPLAKSPGLPD